MSDGGFDVKVKDETPDESVMNEVGFRVERCQEETVNAQDKPGFIQDFSPIVKAEFPSRTVGDNDTLDELNKVISNMGLYCTMY